MRTSLGACVVIAQTIHEGDKFAVASSPAALTHLKESWELNSDAMESLWVLGSVTGEQSMFKGINRLPGGYMATYDIRSNTLTKKRWFEIQPEPASDIEGLVYDAIRSVEVSDVPIHSFLSGGIDSTLITEFLRCDAIHLDSCEKHHAAYVADRCKVNLHVCPVEFDKEKLLQDYAAKSGDCAMSAIQPYVVSEKAKQFGKVAITANGADELFYGYPRTHNTTSSQLRHMMRMDYEKTMAQHLHLYMDGSDLNSMTDDMLERIWELRLYVQCDLCKTLDFASMCHSVEVRSPFLDTRLVNAALAIPYSEHHSVKYGGKHILKTMLSKMGYYDKFLTREKLGFSLPRNLQHSNSDELEWCIKKGFLKRRNDWNARDIIYVSATAAAFKAWWEVWNHKIK